MSNLQYFEFKAMSTQILLAAEGSRSRLETGFQQVRAFIEAEEKRFTRFSEDSELSSLNHSSGSWFEASPEMFEVLSLCRDMNEQTHGLFDPGVLDALEWAGYDHTIANLREFNPGDAFQVKAPPQVSTFAGIRFDLMGNRVFLPPGMRIDLGGIAKGWIAEQAAGILGLWSEACCVDAGGDAFMVGLPSGEDFWKVDLEDPCNPASILAVLKLPPGAVATSSVTKRRWTQAGQVRHHLIDPRTAFPAESDWLCVTAIAETLAEAEVYAKALLIGGSDESTQIAAEDQGVEFIAVNQQGKLWGSKNSKEYIHD
ncbi:MAG: FAD:protein FMN transferase [Anaerolineaceae bacterium]